MFLSFFSSSWCRGLAAVCECGIPRTFLLTFFFSNRFFLKLVTNDRSDKMVLLTSKFCRPQGIVSPCPWAIYMYKTIKKVYKIRLQRDCSKWLKWHEVSVDIKMLSPGVCLPMICGYIHVLNHEKMCKSQKLKSFFLNLQHMTKVMRPSWWHQHFGLNMLSAPAQGLYTCLQSWNPRAELFLTCNHGLSPLALGLYIHVWNKTNYHIK